MIVTTKTGALILTIIILVMVIWRAWAWWVRRRARKQLRDKGDSH